MTIDVTDKIQRRKQMAAINERIRLLEKRKRNKGGLTEEQQEIYMEDLGELVRLERIERAEDDVLFFMYEYFSRHEEPGERAKPDPCRCFDK